MKTKAEKVYEAHLKAMGEALHRGENTRRMQRRSATLHKRARESRLKLLGKEVEK